MRRIPTLGWILVAAVVATVVLNLVAPAAGIVAALALVLVFMAAAAEGMSNNAGSFDVSTVADRKREALTRRHRRGRPHWGRRAPDHADEPADLIWARERERRGLR
jgi:hypothetical protein